MGKIIFWVVVIIGIMLLARIISSRNAASKSVQTTPPPAPPSGPGEQMVRCEHCGIHLPRSEAVMIGGHTWCNQEHARLGARKQ